MPFRLLAPICSHVGSAGSARRLPGWPTLLALLVLLMVPPSAMLAAADLAESSSQRVSQSHQDADGESIHRLQLKGECSITITCNESGGGSVTVEGCSGGQFNLALAAVKDICG